MLAGVVARAAKCGSAGRHDPDLSNERIYLRVISRHTISQAFPISTEEFHCKEQDAACWNNQIAQYFKSR
jgi:hypothetical protein